VAGSPRIFISYARDDEKVARELAKSLRERRLNVWTDESIAPGQNLAAEVGKALDDADAMIVLLTPSSVESSFVQREIEYALSSQRFEHRLIPVVIGAENPAWLEKAPWVLRELKMVVSPNATSASKRVADVLKSAG
jgi:hypothetical protein